MSTTSTHALHLGAIDIETGKYVLPPEASKDTGYTCPDCHAKVILRKGAVRVAHFAHHVTSNPCTYYTHPSESQIHKDAKLLMVKLLTEKRKIRFWWECSNVMMYPCGMDYFEDDTSFDYKDGDEIVTEYRSPDEKWIADVAIVNSGVVRLIVEIRHTHTTTTPRPEPWYELDATGFLMLMNDRFTPGSQWYSDTVNDSDYVFVIDCVRPIKRYCYGSFCYKEAWVYKIPGYDSKYSWNNCLLCNREKYEPVMDGFTGCFQNGQIRVCHDCLKKDTYEKKLRRFV
jgi:hypothetical protein